jgi:beta-lactam-binding protein with PASTA domain
MTVAESGAPFMPMVLRLNLSRARKVITSAIADPQVTIQYSDATSVPPGTVFMHQPLAGREITPDSQIRITVSTRLTAEDLLSSEP